MADNSSNDGPPLAKRPAQRSAPSRSCALHRKQMTEARVLQARLRRLSRRSLDGESLTPAEESELQRHPDACESLTARLLSSRAAQAARQSRRAEAPESATDVGAKVERLASLLADCRGGGCVVYTGAGVSTAADIPDYRGPNGLWTRLPKGALPRFSLPGVEAARPTFAHRFIAALMGSSESASVEALELSSVGHPASSASSSVVLPSSSASLSVLPSSLASSSVGLPASSASSSVGLPASSVSSSVGLPASSASSSVGLPASSVSSSVGLPASSASSSVGLPASSSSSSSICFPASSASASSPVQLPLISHVVSQNCDGLHLRSGVPPSRLSELHGNVFVESCELCGRLVRRRFDVTERSRLRRHATGRVCGASCPGRLLDTVVHFGEFGRRCTADRVYEWRAAEAAASRASLILCLGSSLQVLRHYPSLWPPGVPLAVVNLQATPFDRRAQLSIRADCDSVCRALAERLGVSVPDYRPAADPLLAACEPLLDEAERRLVSRPDIVVADQ